MAFPGKTAPKVEHKLYNPNKYHGERILVVGGGNSAVEAAIALSANNDVTLSYRGDEFVRITKENARRLKESRVKVRTGTRVTGFGPSSYTINGVEELTSGRSSLSDPIRHTPFYGRLGSVLKRIGPDGLGLRQLSAPLPSGLSRCSPVMRHPG